MTRHEGPNASDETTPAESDSHPVIEGSAE